ncbi:MAG: 3-oxo-tetronate kinase [Rhizobiaceae bacterium]
MQNLVFGAIADDLTGGVEIASLLVAGGVRTEFRIGIQEDEPEFDAMAAVVALKSRVAPAAEATEGTALAARWLRRRSPRQMFLKYCATFDCTPEGNIGCCADVLTEIVGADRVIFCPTFPEKERTVYNGHLFVGRDLISESPKRHDPLTPMTEANLVKVLQPQTRYGVGVLPWKAVSSGKVAMAQAVEELVASGWPYIIADAICDADLDAIAEFTADWPLMTGNSTIAACFPAIWRRRGLLHGQPSPARLGPLRGPGAVLAGSCAEQTILQLQEFQKSGKPVLWIDLRQSLSGGDPAAQALAWTERHMGEGEFAIATSAEVGAVNELQQRIGRRAAADLAETVLAHVAVGLVERGLGRLVVAGGETSGAVVNALGIRRLAVGPQKRGSIPIAESDIGRPFGLCLKSGKLGPDDIFEDRLRAMEAGEI